MTVSIWPILVASISAFVISAIWYSPLLFGKEWMALIGATDRDVAEAKAKGMTKSYVIQFIITTMTFIVISFVINITGSYTASNGAFISLIAWLGFNVPFTIGGMLWEKKSLKFAMITSIATLLSWIVGGAIIGGWQ